MVVGARAWKIFFALVHGARVHGCMTDAYVHGRIQLHRVDWRGANSSD
jgi:hypothetical protein